MKRMLITSVMAMIIVALVSAQDYKTGIGIRAGFSSGLTIKHFTKQKAAFEGLLKTRWQGFEVTGLYEIHNQAFDVALLKWFYGGGAHIGFYNGNYVYWGVNGTTYTVVGIDGILGIEYTFSEIPVNIGIDWKPALNLVGYSGLWSEGALSIRFVF
jgi:opacity protein-like surface antigen